MKTYKQADIAEMLDVEPSTASKYLRGKRKINLIDALKVEPELPIKIFVDASLQEKHFGRIYLQDNTSTKRSNTSRPQGQHS